ncbi:hypothetical protein NE237_004827 [Protea cynaroides]|uniref:Uncharacterized protein n=1 Tax=Protea cynaroides TaxID=273540 RepID=A0A9Q0QTW7_9MAGN|nr:hypothetical protein NE237_004827 [Protea cynaroides]
MLLNLLNPLPFQIPKPNNEKQEVTDEASQKRDITETTRTSGASGIPEEKFKNITILRKFLFPTKLWRKIREGRKLDGEIEREKSEKERKEEERRRRKQKKTLKTKKRRTGTRQVPWIMVPAETSARPAVGLERWWRFLHGFFFFLHFLPQVSLQGSERQMLSSFVHGKC